MKRKLLATSLLAAGFVAGAGTAMVGHDALRMIAPEPAHAATALTPADARGAVSPALLPDFLRCAQAWPRSQASTRQQAAG